MIQNRIKRDQKISVPKISPYYPQKHKIRDLQITSNESVKLDNTQNTKRMIPCFRYEFKLKVRQKSAVVHRALDDKNRRSVDK